MPDPAVWGSAFDAPILAGNVAHELTNALFALHLHLDPPGTATRRSRRSRRNGTRRGQADSSDPGRRVIETILGRLDELSRGLRLVARAARASDGIAGSTRTTLVEWWSMARVVLDVSVPKGIDLQADWGPEPPEVDAEPAELTACTVAIIRRVVGNDRVAPPCTLRLIAVPEGRWIRMMAIAHPLSEEFADGSDPGAGERFRLEPFEPCAASVLVSRSDARGASRSPAASGKVP